MIRYLLIFISLLLCNLAVYSQDSLKTPLKLGERKQIYGSHFSLQPPSHFTYSENLKGFIHSGSAASVVITEAENISWIQACHDLTAENLTGQNVSLILQEDVVLKNGMKGKFYVMRIALQSNDTSKQSLEFERLMLFTGDYHRTGWINANYPSMLKPVLYDILRECMLSVEMSDSLNSEIK